MNIRVDVRRLTIALLAVLLAFIVRLALRPFIGEASPFLLFAPAVMIAAFAAGPAAGALATVLSAALGSHFFLAGTTGPTLERWDRVALFVLVGALITILSSVNEGARAKLRESLEREHHARADAEAANRVKDQFLAVVSHELQSPATVILGWVSSIRTRHLSGETLQRALEAIERNARLQSKLVADVLDTSRVASRTLRLDREPTALAPVVAGAIEQVRPVIEARGLQLTADLGPGEVPVNIDPLRIQQVMANLLSNAVKFTPSGGRISVLLTRSAAQAVVQVTDTGVGIRPEFLPRVFDQFEQDAETLAHSRRGLGLGLAISRHLVEAHGGALSAASAGAGCGATFTMTLPIETAACTAHPEAAIELQQPSSPLVH